MAGKSPHSSPSDLARLAAALADRSRAAMCLVLLDGRSWTASELAQHAGIARSTASEHLDVLVDAGVLAQTRQGRHRYLRIADSEIADVVESLAARVPRPGGRPSGLRAAVRDEALARARTCYDHLAGELGVRMTDAMVRRRFVSCDQGWSLTMDGFAWLSSIGVDLGSGGHPRRPVARGCLDWTERRPHLAGAAAAALCRHCFEADWIRRIGSGRAVKLTPSGRQALARELGLRLQHLP